jgi:hypothetical protein
METNAGAGVTTQPKVQTITRTAFLAKFIVEIIRDITGLNVERTIRKGVVLKPIIQGVGILLTKGDKAIGRMTLEIDWEKHAVYLTDPVRKKWHLDPYKSAQEQVSKAIEEMIQYLRQYVQGTEAETTAFFWFRPGLDTDETNEFMQTEGLTLPEYVSGKRIPIGAAEEYEDLTEEVHGIPSTSLVYKFNYRPEKLDEVIISGELVDPKQVKKGDFDVAPETKSEEMPQESLIDMGNEKRISHDAVLRILTRLATEIVYDITGQNVQKEQLLKTDTRVALDYQSDSENWRELIFIDTNFYKLFLKTADELVTIALLQQNNREIVEKVTSFVARALKKKEELGAAVTISFLEKQEANLRSWENNPE